MLICIILISHFFLCIIWKKKILSKRFLKKKSNWNKMTWFNRNFISLDATGALIQCFLRFWNVNVPWSFSTIRTKTLLNRDSNLFLNVPGRSMSVFDFFWPFETLIWPEKPKTGHETRSEMVRNKTTLKQKKHFSNVAEYCSLVLFLTRGLLRIP